MGDMAEYLSTEPTVVDPLAPIYAELMKLTLPAPNPASVGQQEQDMTETQRNQTEPK